MLSYLWFKKNISNASYMERNIYKFFYFYTFMLKNGPSQSPKIQAKVAASLQGWMKSWLNSNIKRKHTWGRSMVRWPGRNKETLSWLCTCRFRKAKTNQVLNLARHAKNGHLQRTITKIRETVNPFAECARGTGDKGHRKGLSNQCFVIGKICHKDSQAPEASGKVWCSEDLLSVE